MDAVRPPIIGITTDFDGEKQSIRAGYARMVAEAGGLPVLLPVEPDLAECFAATLDGFVLSGGDDPNMEEWNIPTHPKATRIHRRRQAFELALLRALDARPDKPVLGVCLGMQLMALHAGGGIDQHLPESDPPAAGRHWNGAEHAIHGDLGWGQIEGVVHSHHRQAIVDPGRLEVAARAEDGMIEAVADAGRAFYLGVQWHPERTEYESLGAELFRRLVLVAQRAATGAEV